MITGKRHVPYKFNENRTRTFYTYHFKDYYGNWQGPCLGDELSSKKSAIMQAVMMHGGVNLSTEDVRIVKHTVTETRRVVRIDKYLKPCNSAKSNKKQV